MTAACPSSELCELCQAVLAHENDHTRKTDQQANYFWCGHFVIVQEEVCNDEW